MIGAHTNANANANTQMHQYMDVVRFGLVRLNYYNPICVSFCHTYIQMLCYLLLLLMFTNVAHTLRRAVEWSNKRCQTLSNQQKKIKKNSWIRNFSDGIRFTIDCCCLYSLFEFSAIKKKQIASQLSRFRWRILCNYSFVHTNCLTNTISSICLYIDCDRWKSQWMKHRIQTTNGMCGKWMSWTHIKIILIY